MKFLKTVFANCARHIFDKYVCAFPCVVGPCHHGMARPQVADRGTASDMEGSCKSIE